MSNNIKTYRRDYDMKSLIEGAFDENPIQLFKSWLSEAFQYEERDPNAFVLSTISSENFPESRIVLLRNFDEKGLVFFTNYNSSKGKSIAENPKVTCTFYWASVERQIRVWGVAQKTSKKVSDAYFKTRPVESQLAAWASRQSEIIPSRADIETQFEAFKKQYEGKEVPRPENWGGYVIVPVKFEFWQGRTGRLHDRIVFEKTNNNWAFKRVQP